MKIGVTKFDQFQEEDYNTLRTIKAEAINVLSRFEFPSGYFVLAQVAPLLAEFNEYTRRCRDEIRPAYDAGCRHFEIHYWANAQRAGLGWTHANGEEFAYWWIAVVRELRKEFKNALFGFPKLEEGDAVGSYRANSTIFRREAYAAIEEADFMSMAVAWKGRQGNMEDLMAAAWNVQSNVLLYRKPIYVITMLTNNNAAKEEKAKQFLRFAAEMQVTPFVQACFYHTLSSSYREDSWAVIRSDSKESIIAEIIGDR